MSEKRSFFPSVCHFIQASEPMHTERLESRQLLLFTLEADMPMYVGAFWKAYSTHNDHLAQM